MLYLKKNYAKRKILLSEAACNISYFTYKYLDVKGKEHFEYYLNSKGIDFEPLNNIYYLNLDDDLISKFIDDEYKFNKDAFDLYSGDLFV